MLTLPVAFMLYNQVTFDWQKLSPEGWTDVSNDDFDSKMAIEMVGSFINIINKNPEKSILSSFAYVKENIIFLFSSLWWGYAIIMPNMETCSLVICSIEYILLGNGMFCGIHILLYYFLF